MPRHTPTDPLPNELHEAFCKQCALGLGPTDAAETVGMGPDWRSVYRRSTFRERLRVLQAAEQPVDDTLTLKDLVRLRKQVLQRALAAGQFKNANEALAQLEGLYDRYPHLRSDVVPARGASSEVAKGEVPSKPMSRLERRMANREALSGVPAAAGEGA